MSGSPGEHVDKTAVKRQGQRTPWLLSLLVFPLLGSGAWFAWALVVPESPESAVNQLPLKAIPNLLAFVAPPVATLSVATSRQLRLAIALALAVASWVVAWLLVAVGAALVFAVGCALSDHDPCLS